MAQEVRVMRPSSFVETGGTTVTFPVSLTGADLSSVTEVVKAPVAGSRIIVTGVLFHNSKTDSKWFKLQENTASASDVMQKFYIDSSRSELFCFPHGIAITEAVNLGVVSESNDTEQGVVIFGYVDYC